MKRLKLIILLAILVVVAGVVVWRTGIYTILIERTGKTSGSKEVAVEKPADANQAVDANKPEAAADVNTPVEVNEPNEPNKPADANQPAEPNEPNEPSDPMEALNLKDVEMKNIIQKLAEWTGKVIIVSDEAMKQKITIYSSQELPRSRALSLIYSALRAKGFVAEHTEDAIYLKPIKEAKLGSVPTIPADRPLATIENRNQVVQKVFKLSNYSAVQMSKIILPLVGEYGYVSADENTGTLMIVDTVENLMRYERIIGQFDVPEAEQTVTKFFPIENADPREVVQLLRILLPDQSGKGKAGGGAPKKGDAKTATSVVIESTKAKIVLIPYPTRRWIIAKASPDDIKRIGEWIEKLDQKEVVESESETIPITFADPHEVASQLNQAFQQMPGAELKTSVLVQALPQARQIMIFGRKEIREMVKKLIREIDIPPGQFETEVIKLEHADPEEIKENIESLYEDINANLPWWRRKRQQSRSNESVRVIAFPTMQQVTVIASAENMVKIKKQIEEWDVPLDVEKVKPKIITLRNSDPVQMVDLLSRLFTEETSGSNRPWWMWWGNDSEDKKKIVGALYGQLTFEAVPDTKKIIVISKIPEAYKVIEELVRDLDMQEMAEVPDVITLNYADPEELSERLNAIFNEPGTVAVIRRRESGLSRTGMESGNEDNQGQGSSGNQNNTARGEYTPPWGSAQRRTDERPISNVIGRIRFIPDPRTKSILVLSPPEFMENIREMIKELDQPGRQVMIKAIVVQIEHSNLTSLGLQLTSDKFVFDPLDENAITALSQLTLLEERGSLRFSASTSVTTLIDFLQKQTDAKILNQQTLWTEDNAEADFFKGDNVAFVEDVSISETGGRVTSGIKFRRVGMTLRVRPSITPEKKVDMIINVIISQLTGDFINEQPVRSEMETTTNMIVQDGETIMLGGILFQEDRTIVRKLPFLGDIPLIGGLFRHNEIVKSNNEVLVFITPYVIDEFDNMLPETIEELENAEDKLRDVLEQLNTALGEEQE